MYDDVVYMLVEPCVEEGPEPLLPLVVPPAVFDEPFLRNALLEVGPDDGHHVPGPLSAQALAFTLGQSHVNSKQGLVVKELVFHQAVLVGLIDPHVDPERDRFIGENCLEANLLDLHDFEVHEIHLFGSYRAVLLVKDIMLAKGPVRGMEQTVVVGELESDGLLEKTLRGVFLQGREPVLLYPVFLAPF